jgi:hypothetical protein
VAVTVVDTEDREPTDQEQEDYNAAMDMSAGELVAVATAYMRRLRAADECGEAHERRDKAAEEAAWEEMFDADDEARHVLGMDDEGCTCAAPLNVIARPKAKAAGVPTADRPAALSLVMPSADPVDADTARLN